MMKSNEFVHVAKHQFNKNLKLFYMFSVKYKERFFIFEWGKIYLMKSWIV